MTCQPDLTLPKVDFKGFLPLEQWPKELQHTEVKGVFVGGCVKRGVGSRFRAKAHAHTFGNDYQGWICFLSAKRLSSKELCIHEAAHIITGEGHTDKWREKVKELGGTILEVPGILKAYSKRVCKRNTRNPENQTYYR